MGKEEKHKTMKRPVLISIALSVAIIIVILLFTFDAKTLDYLTSTNIRYEFFIAAIFVNILYWVCWGGRLKTLSNAIDKNVKISLKESTEIIMANLFLANITPSMAGGEPVRIYLLNKNGLSIGDATAAVLSERLLDAVFLLMCFPFAFIILSSRLETGPLKIGLAIAFLVFISLLAAFAYAIKYPEKMKRFLIWINKKTSKFSKKKERESKTVAKINREVNNFHNSMVFLLSEGKLAFIKAFILTALFWAVGWMIPILILMGLGLGPHVIESTAAQILMIIIVMMPTTPGSAGITEGGIAALYSVFIDSSLVGVFVLVFRLMTYHLGLIVGGIYQYKIFKSVFSFSLDSIKGNKT